MQKKKSTLLKPPNLKHLRVTIVGTEGLLLWDRAYDEGQPRQPMREVPAHWLKRSIEHVAKYLEKTTENYKKVRIGAFIVGGPLKVIGKPQRSDARLPLREWKILRVGNWFQKWSLTFLLSYDANVFTKEDLRDLYMRAGIFAGIGDFRRAAGGPYGTFRILRMSECPRSNRRPGRKDSSLAA